MAGAASVVGVRLSWISRCRALPVSGRKRPFHRRPGGDKPTSGQAPTPDNEAFRRKAPQKPALGVGLMARALA